MISQWLTTLLIMISVGSIAATIHWPASVYKASTAVTEADFRAGYAGDTQCARCHTTQSVSYLHTAHKLTSRIMGDGATQGVFVGEASSLRISEPAPAIGDPGTAYRMEKREMGFYVNAITGFPGDLQTRSERMDLVVGAGVRGQSFLHWSGDDLFELPVSFWTDGRQWINSPGYRNGPPNFDRPATARCLECHFSYAEALPDNPRSNTFKRESVTTGISCEVCHGPGARHVALFSQTQTKARKLDALILNPKSFSRDRQVDLCALCHNGAGQQEIKPAFSYIPGALLREYLREDTAALDTHPDVHANQVGLLKRSKCYVNSPSMTCTTCHDVHAPERVAASYSAKCLSCHRVENCRLEKTMGPSIASNCVDCHMTMEKTNAIVSQTGDKVIRTRMRTHWIQASPILE